MHRVLPETKAYLSIEGKSVPRASLRPSRACCRCLQPPEANRDRVLRSELRFQGRKIQLGFFQCRGEQLGLNHVGHYGTGSVVGVLLERARLRTGSRFGQDIARVIWMFRDKRADHYRRRLSGT